MFRHFGAWRVDEIDVFWIWRGCVDGMDVGIEICRYCSNKNNQEFEELNEEGYYGNTTCL